MAECQAQAHQEEQGEERDGDSLRYSIWSVYEMVNWGVGGCAVCRLAHE